MTGDESMPIESLAAIVQATTALLDAALEAAARAALPPRSGTAGDGALHEVGLRH